MLEPLGQRPTIVLIGDLILSQVHGYSFLKIVTIGWPDGTAHQAGVATTLAAFNCAWDTLASPYSISHPILRTTYGRQNACRSEKLTQPSRTEKNTNVDIDSHLNALHVLLSVYPIRVQISSCRPLNCQTPPLVLSPCHEREMCQNHIR